MPSLLLVVILEIVLKYESQASLQIRFSNAEYEHYRLYAAINTLTRALTCPLTDAN